MLYSIARVIIIPLVYLLFNIKFEGRENLKTSGGYVVCPNHRTLWDPLFIAVGIRKRKLNFMAKMELFKFKPFGFLLKKLGAFPVNRGKGDLSAISSAVERVKNGNVLLIFPEGTRSKTEAPLRPKAGAIYIAAETGADIVPAAICFEGKKLGFRKKVTICFGKPIPSSEIEISNDKRASDIRKASVRIFDKIIEMLNLHLTKQVPLFSKPEIKKEEETNEN